ncbi:threonine aldolase family protein [Paenibacillus provencensis]|uniref:Threonine aldolase family protein n=1 Tax=Paenibacillus provencensis TaxID=441151 RepID=A0ABW3PRR9_9BACL|nr:beta-eliminating lyase-related protein [Paenibacillus sp. MER 78]MCM3129122.1 beta-eliminating lyase-related protein [Paenibacillus sp. MER 78]
MEQYNNMTLSEAYNKSEYPILGNGRWNIQMLKDAFEHMDGDIAGDRYGTGKVIEDFERKIADLLGKESAVFFPSGTMAQQIAMRIWSDEKDSKIVAYHPLSHLEIHEEDGLKELHHLEPLLLGEENRLIRLQDVKQLGGEVACLLLELPQREIGGQLPAFEELMEISTYCKEQGIRLHLDGARLFETIPYYGRPAAEICALFDSVYVSFYKGIGGIAGAILAGPENFTTLSKVWKRRHGGDLIGLYPYILSSDYYFNKRIDRMTEYYNRAKELAELFNQCTGVRAVPQVPVTNMFHLHFHMSARELETILIDIYTKTGVGLISFLREVHDQECKTEISIGDRYGEVPKERLYQAIQLLQEKMIK